MRRDWMAAVTPAAVPPYTQTSVSRPDEKTDPGAIKKAPRNNQERGGRWEDQIIQRKQSGALADWQENPPAGFAAAREGKGENSISGHGRLTPIHKAPSQMSRSRLSRMNGPRRLRLVFFPPGPARGR